MTETDNNHKRVFQMNKTFILLVAIAMALITSCASPSGETAQTSEESSHEHHDHDHDHTDGTVEEGDGKHFGETISEEGAIPFGEMVEKMAGVDSMDFKVIGEVSEVCQAKGCWMTIAPGTEGGEEMIVQFKDYGFFVPKDISGRQVIIEGYAYRAITPVEDLKHLAEDAGKSQEEIDAITEPQEELKFLASGVILLDPTKE